MHVVVLQRPGSTAAYDCWILQAAPWARVTVITSRDTVRPDSVLGPGVRRVLVDDYESDAVPAELFRICGQDPPEVCPWIELRKPRLPLAELRRPNVTHPETGRWPQLNR